jgi:hypothetical protein
MASEAAATKILDELVTNVRRYNDLMRQMDQRLQEAQALRDEAVPLRLNIEGTVGVLKSLASNVPDEATARLFLVLADCFSPKAS